MRIGTEEEVKGYIPSFLASEWQERERKRGRYITRSDYDPISDYRLEYRRIDNHLMWGFVYVLVGGMGLLLILLGWIGVFKFDNHKTIWVGLVMFLIGVTMIVNWCRKYPSNANLNGHRFYGWLSQLYTEFSIPLDEKVGQMKKEFFRMNIEDELREQAMTTDKTRGFRQGPTREAFERKHKIALEGELCHSDHAGYFPINQKMKY